MEQSVTSLVTRSHAKKNDGTFSNIVSQDSGYSVDSETDGRAQERLSLRASPSNRFVPIFDKIVSMINSLLSFTANMQCKQRLSGIPERMGIVVHRSEYKLPDYGWSCEPAE